MPKSRRGKKSLSVYANLSNRRKANKDAAARRKAEYLASLPKHPVKRLLYRLHPKRFFAYWFSRQGAIMALKIAGVGTLVIALLFGALFAYYRRELDAIRPGELSKRVQTTVTKYTDRNGILLWEDKGDGDYKLVVDSKDISKYMKDATVAIEDKDFYKHGGFSLSGILRAALSNSGSSGDTQGGSTLTQQLVKQVFLADEAQNRGLSGIPRKIKEVILSVEVERMYNKDQILTLYLNESPYGGRRNGVESASQAYFGKSAKDLTLAESALLASIPQSPTRFNPYNTDSDAVNALISRKNTVLDYMADQGLVPRAEAEAAKKVAILDTVKPEESLYGDMKAPHFVQMVKSDLEAKLGKKVMGEGGLTIKTTLDWRTQQIVDKAIDDLFSPAMMAQNARRGAKFDNASATLVDAQTGQILALRGSRAYNYPGYGSVNVANSFLQPGSSVKPFVYAALFEQKTGVNYGAGSILSDDPLPQSVYKTAEGTSVQNFDGKFMGAIPIRNALPESRNIPAIKALLANDKVNGDGATIKTIQKLGDKSYCSQGQEKTVGPAASLGGCGLKQIEHANTFATLARMGVYKPVADVLEVKNSQGQIIQQWKDEGKQVIDAQIPYIIADILSDDRARSRSYGTGAVGLNVTGVKTGAKTGTSNIGKYSKDLWINSFSPKAALSVWVGNNDPSVPIGNALSSILGPTINTIQHDVHYNVFQPDGTWKPGDWFTKPAGVQTLAVNGRSDLFPSWFKQSSASAGEKIAFDRVSKKKATNCTPAAAKIEVTVQKTTDPVTNKTTYVSIDGYDATADDDAHKCDDVKPFVTTVSTPGNKIRANVTKGTFNLQTVEFLVDGQSVGSVNATASGTYEIEYSGSTAGKSISVIVTDAGYYSATYP
ncbi:penicillin-binding protein [Candidatus Saccharibacteria bacterium]|nr:MAG: penicillin-binding protein [Candidatus Saccharibacteria bacterium]